MPSGRVADLLLPVDPPAGPVIPSDDPGDELVSPIIEPPVPPVPPALPAELPRPAVLLLLGEAVALPRSRTWLVALSQH